MPPRQSTRIKAQPKAEDGESKYVLSSDDEYESDEAIAGPSTASPKVRGSKRKRKATAASSSTTTTKKTTSTAATTLLGLKDDSGRPTKKLRGKRGFLQQIAEMPLELLFEIFGQLDPIDVLNLARTTKSLRAILMQKSAADIWRASLENLPGLPPTPDDISEPRWVDLLFGKNCHVCGRTTSFTTQTYAWEARLRGCSKCVLGEFSWDPPEWPYSQLVPTFTAGRAAPRSQRGVRFYNVIASQLRATYESFKSEEEKKKWVDEKKAEKAAIAEHAKLCARWLENQRQDRLNELEDMRQNRKDTLRDKVEGMGYSPALVELTLQEPAFWSAPCVVSILKKDVERAWPSSESAFVELMDGFKTRLAKQQRDHCIKKRFDVFISAYNVYAATRPLEEPLPTPADLFQAEGVKDFILAEPVEEEIDKDVVQEFVNNKAAEYQEEWLKAAKAKIVGKMKPKADVLGLDKDALDESTLDLAVAMFTCKYCYSGEHHASVLPFHACARTRGSRRYGGPELPESAGADDDLKTFVSHTQTTPWDIWDCFTLSEVAARIAVVIRKLDLDPATVTLQQLDARDPIFEIPAPVSNGLREMYSWRGLAARQHSALEPNSFRIVDDEETSAFVRFRLDEAQRAARVNASSYSNTINITCTHCRKVTTNSKEVRKHLQEAHEIDVATNDDVWIHPDNRYSSRVSITYYKHPGATVI